MPLFEQTLKLRKAKLGPEHPDTLLSMNNLAWATMLPASWPWPCRCTSRRSNSRRPNSASTTPIPSRP